jgi:hypothetical protein
MDAKELISQSDLQSFYQQQQQQHRAFGGHHSPSSLAGMHSVIRPMPNMNMSPTAILNSISGGSLAGMQFQMDPPPPLLHNINATGAVTPAPAEPLKRKRGRPRKYGPDGTMRQQQQQQAASSQQQLVATQPRICSLSSGPDMLGSSGMEDPAQKKRRGRPPGTGKKHQPSTSQGSNRVDFLLKRTFFLFKSHLKYKKSNLICTCTCSEHAITNISSSIK